MYLSIISLNVNGLKAPIKRHRVTEWVREQDPFICCLQEVYFRIKDTHRTIVKRWKKIFHASGNFKEKAGEAILILKKIDFKTKDVVRGKEGHYIMVKGKLQQEDVTLVNICAHKTGAPE